MNSKLIEKMKRLPDSEPQCRDCADEDGFCPNRPMPCDVSFANLKQLAADHERLVKQTRWIPCSERLPVEDRTYEVTTYGMALGVKTEPVVLDDLFINGHFEDPYVIAWREKSEPYKP